MGVDLVVEQKFKQQFINTCFSSTVFQNCVKFKLIIVNMAEEYWIYHLHQRYPSLCTEIRSLQTETEQILYP